MSEIGSKGKIVALIVAIITIIGLVCQAVPANELQGLFANIFYGGSEKWYQNPIILAILISIFVNFFGYVENTVIKKQPYDVNKFAETYLKYLPMLVIFTQYLEPGQASTLAIALDIISRAIKRAGSTTSAVS